MKIAMVMCFFLFSVLAQAEDKKAQTPKPSKPKPAAKSEKNVFQKAESSVGQWAHENKVWVKKKQEK